MDFEEVEDKEWRESSKLTKEQKKQKAAERWEQAKKDWQELTEVEHFDNEVAGKWVQKGPYLMKKDAKLEFATYVGNDVVLTGIDENGSPVLEKRR